MKSAAWSSFQSALPPEARQGGERDDDDPITDPQLIRQWWYVYLWTLKQAGPDLADLDALTAECERRGIVRPGVPMTRHGAEDMAKQCDEELAKRRKQWS